MLITTAQYAFPYRKFIKNNFKDRSTKWSDLHDGCKHFKKVKIKKLGATVLAFLEVTDIYVNNLFSSTSSNRTSTVECSRYFSSKKLFCSPIHCPNANHSTGSFPFIQSCHCSCTLFKRNSQIIYVQEQHDSFREKNVSPFTSCQLLFSPGGRSVLLEQINRLKNYDPLTTLSSPKLNVWPKLQCITMQLKKALPAMPGITDKRS